MMTEKTEKRMAVDYRNHPPVRIFACRLKSGHLLMDRLKTTAEAMHREYRVACISEDDGKSRSDGMIIDKRYGISYPDGFQHQDGNIYIAYNHLR